MFEERQGEGREPSAAGGEPRRGDPEAAEGSSGSGGKRFTVEQKLELLARYQSSGKQMRDFCSLAGISTATLCKWRRQLAGSGEGALQDRPSRRNSVKRTPARSYTADERRAAIEAYLKSGRTQLDFARIWGVPAATFGKWMRRWKEGGPQGLEDRPKRGSAGRPRTISAATRQEIVRTKSRFPDFGLRKVRDFLRRFGGVKVSAGSVRATLREAGVAPQPAARRKPRAKKQPPRRFERARPGQLWQSDITSFVLRRHSLRVYLTVFLDDCSRYVVAFALEAHQRQELVSQALLEGIGRFGKPREVLTDQGRQYFAWRGKSAFQKLLEREGIAHVVSRTHHPQTLGKCERLWATVNREFWERARPEDLSEARERLSHFFAHYNHFRPHQGIDGLVPADRFFGAEEALRRTLEAQLSANELAQALGEGPRQPVFLFGQIGDQQVSVHGEKGRLVIQTPQGGRQEMRIEELGVSEETSDAGAGERAGSEREAAAQEAHGQEARGVPGAPEAGAVGEGAVAPGQRGAAAEGARDVRFGAGVLAGEGDEVRAGREAGGAALEGLAAVPDGGVGYAGGPAEAAEGERSEGRGRSPGRHQGAAQGERRPARAAAQHRGAGEDPAGLPGAPRPASEQEHAFGEGIEVEAAPSDSKKKEGEAGSAGDSAERWREWSGQRPDDAARGVRWSEWRDSPE
jgi:transposase InsO family protein